MSDPENDSKTNRQQRGPKHMRLRYYTSYEEATIVKVWREHLHEITSYTENLTIFREIAFGLQQHRIRLNKQEVRRRISSYRNKYLLERSRFDNDPQYKSNWRLYSLVDCLFHPSTTVPVVKTELKQIDELESKVRKEMFTLPRFSRHDCKTIHFEQNPNGCPFLEVQQQQQQQQQLLHIKSETFPQPISSASSNDIKTNLEALSIASEKRSPLIPANRIKVEPQLPSSSSASASQQQEQQPSSTDFSPYVRRSRRRTLMPRTGSITLAQIERLQKENELLAEQRDTDMADLELKEREYQQLEQTFDFWLHQQETWLTWLDEQESKFKI